MGSKRRGGDDETPKRHRQQAFKGMEAVDIPELTEAGEAYEDAMLARVKKTEAETEAHDALVAVMHKFKRTVYRSPNGLVVTLTPGKEKAKVKRVDQDTVEGASE